MSAYIVLTRDDKSGTCYPDIIGPFATDEEADACCDLIGNRAEDGEGGYAGNIVVSDRTADWSASDYLDYRHELLGEYEMDEPETPVRANDEPTEPGKVH